MKTFCPNCNTEINTGFLKQNRLVDEKLTNCIHEFTDNKAESYCAHCLNELLLQAKSNYRKEVDELKKFLDGAISTISIVTVHNPYNWEYEILGMVSAQSVIGTGVISEIASSWTDFFGKESNSFNDKIKKGEDNCMNQLRSKAIKLNAHAIIGTDIDYSEVGGGKGMLMVCMAGTAIRFTNPEQRHFDTEAFDALIKAKSRLEYLLTKDIEKETLYMIE